MAEDTALGAVIVYCGMSVIFGVYQLRQFVHFRSMQIPLGTEAWVKRGENRPDLGNTVLVVIRKYSL